VIRDRIYLSSHRVEQSPFLRARCAAAFHPNLSTVCALLARAIHPEGIRGKYTGGVGKGESLFNDVMKKKMDG